MLDKIFNLRMEQETFDKIVKISAISERSINAQILYMIKNSIEDFEKAYGKIEEKK